MTRHFLKDDDITSSEQAEILLLARKLKQDRFSSRALEGPKAVALIFDKTSTRTRVSFSVGVAELGGVALVMDSASSQMGKKESVADTARVLDRQVALIAWRTYAQSGLEEMAEYSSVPVINTLSADYHPCQLLADLLTIQEHLGELPGRVLTYIGDASNNMANSYMLAGAMAGMHVRIVGPKGYLPKAKILERATEIAKTTAGSVQIFTNPMLAAVDADVLATDTWVSMGQESEQEKRIQDFKGFSIDSEMLKMAKDSAIVLHCLPAYRGLEISAEVLDGNQSVIWDQAENRLHAQKALMVWLLEH